MFLPAGRVVSDQFLEKKVMSFMGFLFTVIATWVLENNVSLCVIDELILGGSLLACLFFLIT